MKDSWLNKWNQRFAKEGYTYGKDPNVYLREQLTTLPPGKILFPAEGEGRNAVFAAKLGWEVSAFDISVEGKKKALKLAEAEGVTIDYQVGTLDAVSFKRS
ncbi:class I SAM-dependent methyltransferase [Pricia sp. S334]|uniref:Class I SAM-dependent methyltransferase n=1 Tax=Pricia mediterranea TaxID=3076079 RepID=A0ABU3L7U7_9FLAO|nr:class I SAM-dependent methyltransferase [Pricia sp. S334]MDT7829762.1 class I SAM-dependent methyltransferase [Pricia sp. S334]